MGPGSDYRPGPLRGSDQCQTISCQKSCCFARLPVKSLPFSLSSLFISQNTVAFSLSLSLNQSLNFRGFHRIDHVHSFKAQGSQGQYSNPNTMTALDRALICRISRPHVLQKPSDRASGVFHSCSVDLIFSSLRFFAAVGKV